MSQKPLIHIVQPADTEGLPAFAGMPLERISMPATAVEFALAATEILQASCIGFDTESKPTFKVGELSSGPHLIQFASWKRSICCGSACLVVRRRFVPCCKHRG